MPQYETYKESDAAWIGKIPSYWEVGRLKTYLKRTDARNPGGVQVLSLYRDLGIVPKDSRDDNHNVTSEDTSNYKYVEIGDFVVNKMKAWQGSVAVSEYEGIVSPAYYVYKFLNNKFHKRYFHYLIRSCYKDEFMRLSAGIRIGQWDLSSDDLDCTLVLIPPMEEQIVMSEFLDKKIAHIESLIEEAKASIEEYKAWKASIIYEAVTKGLDPNVEMRNSGVEWIGKIPSHWKCTKVRQIAEFINGFAFQSDDLGSEGKYPVVKIGDIQDGKVNFMSCQCTSLNEELSGVQIKKEDILLAMSGATVGKVGYVFDMPLKNSYINQRVGIYRMKETPKFYFYIFSQPFYVEYALLNASGTAQPNISTESAKNFFVPIPPLNERETICKYLDKICPNIDEVIADKKALIEDLESYKKSLIFEVVTGKRKVL